MEHEKFQLISAELSHIHSKRKHQLGPSFKSLSSDKNFVQIYIYIYDKVNKHV